MSDMAPIPIPPRIRQLSRELLSLEPEHMLELKRLAVSLDLNTLATEHALLTGLLLGLLPDLSGPLQQRVLAAMSMTELFNLAKQARGLQ